MPMLTFFSDEHVITNSDNGSVMLTSHRICFNAREWGRMYNQSIMLEHVTSCEHHYATRYWLLIIAAVGVSGIMYDSTEVLIICLLTAVMFCILFVATRRNVIIIGSPSTKMLININKMDADAALHFVDQVETAKYRLTTKSVAVSEEL